MVMRRAAAGFGIAAVLAGAPLHAETVDARGKAWWGHVTALANDDMKGRMAGSPDYDRAAAYVVAQFRKLGLSPAGTDGYYQPMELTEQRFAFDRSQAALSGAGGEIGLAIPDDFYPRGSQAMPATIAAPLIFIGYGLHLPEAGLDDLAGIDFTGKIAVVISGGPEAISGALKSNARSERAKLLADRGAIGVIALTTARQIEIPWNRQTLIARAPSMALADPEMNGMKVPFLTAWIDPAKSEALFAGSGRSFAEIAALADASKPIPGFALTQTLRATIAATRAGLRSANIVARLPGRDPDLSAENVVLSAHLDGLGVGEPIAGDAIYNGALDNASGVSSVIEIAKALKAGRRPKRSIVFAIVTGEEKGLLGSHYFAHRPSVPAGSIVADLNFDMALPIFALTSVTPLGYEESSLGRDAAAIGARMGLPIAPDPFPDRNSFTRSDQYSFIREGIPALFFKYGFAAGTPEAKIEHDWRATIYHSPRDDLNQPVMPAEAVKLNDYVTALTQRVANDPVRPSWNADSFFRRFAK